ncbi:hypothetical protein LC087_12685 [Bacillus carboniphilus]|uniref:Permease n=1 Tax=Bacillus carboniphilus TaxID=86663 RepID=A0ABY9JTG0_9BACI|nr:hypothetical protein [Bacillus carboniphilus]WLR41715.1 hypothetical protein LC087_12685 [Bacillus carboniphilus]
MTITNILTRKFFVGIIVLILCSSIFLLNSLLMGIDILDALFYIALFAIPILLFYAPLWSTISEIFVDKRVKYKKNSTMLILHALGGAVLPYLLAAVFKPEDFLNFLKSSSSISVVLVGILFSLLYMQVDRLFLKFKHR